jgi:hypothetical protein
MSYCSVEVEVRTIGKSEQHDRLGQDSISQDSADLYGYGYGRDTECVSSLPDYYILYQGYVIRIWGQNLTW